MEFHSSPNPTIGVEIELQLVDDNTGLFVFNRSLGSQSITGVFNTSSSIQNIERNELIFLNECTMLNTNSKEKNNKISAKSYQIWDCNG